MCQNIENIEKKRVLSCIQPSGMLTLGNYLGALKNWVAMQNEFDCTFAVADLHAITVRQEPAKLRAQIYSTYALLLALGIDPEKNTSRARARTAFVAAILQHTVRRNVTYDTV